MWKHSYSLAALLIGNICSWLCNAHVHFCFSVVQQREQHQHSRPHIWELHQPLRHGPLQPGRLGKPLRTGRASKHGVLPAHQPHPETRPLPEPAEPRPPQGHMIAWRDSLCSATRGACCLRDVTCWSTSLSSSHLSPVTAVSLDREQLLVRYLDGGSSFR